VLHALTNASEAANNISKNDPEAKSKFTDFPFKKLIATRNKFIHKYWNVSDSIIYGVAIEDAPELQSKMRVIFQEDLESLSKISHRSVLDLIKNIHSSDLKTSDITEAIKIVTSKDKTHAGGFEP
jgi:hypothetical protein